MKGQLHMSPLKGVIVGEAANGPGVPRGCRGGEERALPLSFQFSQMKNFWSSVSRQRQRTEHYVKRVQAINCVLRVSYDITEAAKAGNPVPLGKRERELEVGTGTFSSSTAGTEWTVTRVDQKYSRHKNKYLRGRAGRSKPQDASNDRLPQQGRRRKTEPCCSLP